MSWRLHNTNATCLNEIRRLVGGECHKVVNLRPQSVMYWRPTEFVANPISNLELAERAVLRVTSNTVQSWGSQYSKVLHLLSGGLDSAVVLSCLRAFCPHLFIVCANAYYPKGSNNDERVFARAAARSCGVVLLEYEPDSTFDATQALNVPLSANWMDVLSAKAWREKGLALAQRLGAHAIFSGDGGDEIFFKEAPRFAFCDYVRRHGLVLKSLRYALESASAQNMSLWRTIIQGVREGRSRDPLATYYSKLAPSSLLTLDAARMVARRDEFLHPWLACDSTVPLGKLMQISILAVSHSPNDAYPLESGVDGVDPLISQPLMELGLQIETHLLSVGGVDRAVVRRAFRSHVCAAVLRRRRKSYINEFFNHLVAHNNDVLRQVLECGALVNEGILARSTVEGLFANAFDRARGHGMQICAIFGIENWLSSVRRNERAAATNHAMFVDGAESSALRIQTIRLHETFHDRRTSRESLKRACLDDERS